MTDVRTPERLVVHEVVDETDPASIQGWQLAVMHADPDFPEALQATLLFVCVGDEVLLIEKRRGHGAGLINAPGGKLEGGESPRACALRETREEIGIEVDDARLLGELRFQDVSGERVRGWVFRGSAYRGRPVTTAEAVPCWHLRDAMPYGEMWPGDRFWIPWLLADHAFRATLLCRGEQVLEVLVSLVEH